MTDEAFAQFCAEHPDLNFEMTAQGELIVLPPPYSITGIRQGKIFAQLNAWAEADGHGIAGEATTSFVLPNGARRSPDASWTPKAEVRKLTPESREAFWHLCPAFVVELRSKTDRLNLVREKMREYITNGAQLGWLIDPETRTVEIYRPNRDPETLANPTSLTGEGLLQGFTLDLTQVWDPLGA
jgi:Uma2 family endonuclease